jgi:hypothetical protein
VKRRAWQAVNGIWALMFAFSVAVQYNDPDPLFWMLIYGAAAVVCVREVMGKSRWEAAAAIGVIALIWAGTISPRVLGVVPFGSMFESFEMQNAQVEESREMYGLLLITMWMLVVAYVSRRRPGGIS